MLADIPDPCITGSSAVMAFDNQALFYFLFSIQKEWLGHPIIHMYDYSYNSAYKAFMTICL